MRACHPYFYGTIEQRILHPFAVSWLHRVTSGIRFGYLLSFLSSETIHAADDICRIISIAFAVSTFDVGFAVLELGSSSSPGNQAEASSKRLKQCHFCRNWKSRCRGDR